MEVDIIQIGILEIDRTECNSLKIINNTFSFPDKIEDGWNSGIRTLKGIDLLAKGKIETLGKYLVHSDAKLFHINGSKRDISSRFYLC